MSIPLQVAIDPHAILDLLAPILPGLATAVLSAVGEAKLAMASSRVLDLYDWNHHASTVRILLRREVRDAPIHDEFFLLHEASSGVHGKFRDIRIKVLKDPTDLPIATVTNRRKGYLRQPEIQMAFAFDCTGEIHELHLVLYWEVDATYNLRSLRLACPVDAQGDGAEEKWSVPVTHLIGDLLEADEPPAVETQDLDISAKQDATSEQIEESPERPSLDIQPKDDDAEAEDAAGELG